MSFLSKIREYKESQKRKNDEYLQRKGFGWVMTEFFYSNMCLMEIESYIIDPFRSEFDYGAMEAINLIKDNNYQKPKKKK